MLAAEMSAGVTSEVNLRIPFIVCSQGSKQARESKLALKPRFRKKLSTARTDPGFPVGGAPTLGWGATFDFAKIYKKLHEMEKILGHRRDAPL